MRSHQLNLAQYATDKVANKYPEWYDPVLEPWLDKKIALLELGVAKGGSLLFWRDYFPQANVVGIDIQLPEGFIPGERVQVFQGSQTDTRFLTQIASKVAPEGFDIIIDDASHIAALTRVSFWHLFENHLKAGGLFVIEDWGCGYWDDWSDGRTVHKPDRSGVRSNQTFLERVVRKLGIKRLVPSHCYGLVGLVKELVDEQGAHDLTRGSLQGKPQRSSRFQSMLITPSIVFITKAPAGKR